MPVPSGLPPGPAALRVTNLTTSEVSEGVSINIVAISLTQVASAARGTSNLSVGLPAPPTAGSCLEAAARRSAPASRCIRRPSNRRPAWLPRFRFPRPALSGRDRGRDFADADSGTAVGIHRHGCWDAVEQRCRRRQRRRTVCGGRSTAPIAFIGSVPIRHRRHVDVHLAPSVMGLPRPTGAQQSHAYGLAGIIRRRPDQVLDDKGGVATSSSQVT